MSRVFDFQVHGYSREGKVDRSNPYRMVIDDKGKRIERPPMSGMWYNEDGTLHKDESAIVQAKRIADEKLAKEAAEKEAKDARDKLRAEILAEIEAEKKEAKHGSSTKT